ncbi:leucyl aminopeptidase family protein [Marinihelvus fidelis]|uniref:Leucyl aminopeptidase family protein n=1 Tax=Marinihelvus fidelis TaxID=2613842 RepID=A0A5N0T9Z3_9GAMM|nr:leucyl aminopeptidase family protein [Marinihelvus fidelis]KAA9130937.1 leucyl aminopeptidase family protein [Marinihelvus fidelis]
MPYLAETIDLPIRLTAVSPDTYEQWLAQAPAHHRAWLDAHDFSCKAGKWAALPSVDGGIEQVIFADAGDAWIDRLARAATGLPAGAYALDCDWSDEQKRQAALGWGLAQYRFTKYKDRPEPEARLVLGEALERQTRAMLDAQNLVRDLVNTPTEDMGPGDLGAALASQAQAFGASFSVIEGEQLLEQNFPAIHAVGRAAARAPRLLSLEWGREGDPLVVLAGKGVCFDTGGLDIKPSSGMILMKKDMGGAAHVIALARLVMQAGLPVRLRVLVPAVENAISGNAYRPGDVIPTRKGLSVEIGNTDAEGRVVLSDALALACEQAPDLVIDFATLTGAARVAMGPDIPPVFSNRKDVARGLVDAGETTEDPLWELPLYKPYRKLISSDIADVNNSGKTAFAGAITAALFLEKFIDPDIPWAHIDTFAWNPTGRAGRPAGGEALGLRATFEFLRQRYATTA